MKFLHERRIAAIYLTALALGFVLFAPLDLLGIVVKTILIAGFVGSIFVAGVLVLFR
jgi:hypothetical protein